MIENFIKEVKEFYDEVYKTDFSKLSLKQLEQFNSKMNEFYSNSIVCKKDTEEERIYSFVAYQILGYYSYFTTKSEDAKIYMKYINEILENIENGSDKIKNIVLNFVGNVSRAVSKIIYDNTTVNNSVRKIVMESDLNSYNYLYSFGKNITDNQLKIVDYLNKIEDKTILDMAKCTIDAFFRGMKNSGIDIEKKTFLVLWYNIGFEKLAKKIVELLEGRVEVILRVAKSSYNKQVDYNHRYDYNLYLTSEYTDKYLKLLNKELEKNKKCFSRYAGPIFVELFGEDRFVPQNGNQVFEKSDKLSKINAKFDTKFSNIYMKYIRKDTSFCIISYPCPQIGKDFEKIFEETIKLNTLDNGKYQKIHQNIIEVLDKSKYVHITGKNGNKTDLIVSLMNLENPNSQTLFENCCADVNVPVGEVFTSPKLSGTNGILHVSKIYLNGWKFENLQLEIKNGFIEKFSCTNYLTEEENKEYINEHLLYDHKTLPMGEFAIGTNTYAYVMGNKYNINDKLDILIAEKTGPHFAFGDTCFSMDEDKETFNPNGKKIVAKDNEVSIKRLSNNKEEAEKAYFGCHTDVTIPYQELGDIKAFGKNEEFLIIHDGKFVLRGTEELNIDGM